MNHKEFPTSRPPQWARQLDEESFSWQEAVGGWRGFIESILPGLVFVVCFVVTRDVMLTSILSAGTALIALAARLLQRQSISQAISGFFGVGIGALWALASGKGENFYAFGLIISAFFFLGVLLTILVGRPFVSIGVGAFWALPKGWWPRKAPAGNRALAFAPLAGGLMGRGFRVPSRGRGALVVDGPGRPTWSCETDPRCSSLRTRRVVELVGASSFRAARESGE